MPRRRSHGLTLGAVGAGVLLVAGCQAGQTDNGCQIQRQLVMPGTTPLALLANVRIDRVGSGYAIFGADETAVRWAMIDAAGTIGAEQSYPLPGGTLRPMYAAAGVNTPGDTVVIGLLVTAANGTDAELRFVAAPADGSAAPSPGSPVTTFGGADPQVPPLVAVGPSASGMYAGAAWLEYQTGYPTAAFIDGAGQVVGAPRTIDTAPASAFSCFGFAAGKEELTVTYQRGPTDPRAPPTWMIADISLPGAISTLTLNVAQPGGTMSCALTGLYDNGGSPEYSILWQDPAGSWLSVYYGTASGMVKSFGFASSTDFGGPDLQPPLTGFATFGPDFGVQFAKPHSVELWRLDQRGNTRPGSLVFPSVAGNITGVSSVASGGLLTSTYADLTGVGTGRRVVIDSVCR
jgi:hypothetical protein